MDTVCVTIPSYENELRVLGTYYPGSPGSMYKRNGDPGDPPEDPEFDIHHIFDGDKEVTQEFIDDEDLYEAILEKIGEVEQRYDEPEYD